MELKEICVCVFVSMKYFACVFDSLLFALFILKFILNKLKSGLSLKMVCIWVIHEIFRM